MRIAINTRFLLKNKLEGIGWFTYEVCKRLVEQHPEHEFIFFFDRPFEAEFVFGKNVTPIVLFPPARHPILFYIWFEYAVVKALKKYEADVFLSPDNFCALRTEIPTVLVVHDLAYAHFPEQMRMRDRVYYRNFMPKFLYKASKIVTVSGFTKQDILKRHSINKRRIIVACNGVRKIFQSLLSEEKEQVKAQFSVGKDYFFYIGAVHPRKNVHRLIEAFDRFKKETQSDLKLLIAGRFSWQTGEVKNAYDSANYQNDIEFLGYVEDALLPKLMASAFALTYISTFEGFGVPLLEAMHCEIPIITSENSSMSEVVGEAAILINPFDVNSISAAMRQMTRDADLRKQLVEKGKKQRQNYSWQKATDIIYDACINALKAAP
ncbi:MAG: glycosyltransferase family 1 protein [Bacteroidota bacterium]